MISKDEKSRILVVDDVPQNIKLLHESMQEDYNVYFATSGAEALKMVSAINPHIVLLDIMMPEMDGYEVCRRLKADPLTRDIPVIFITAMDQLEHEMVGLKLGAVDYITKPFNPALIGLRLKNQLELKRQRDELTALANIDGLTGVKNRRAFDEYCGREWLRAIRDKHPVSILMIDIDHFKDFNDHYGHIAGDDCLKAVAKRLAETIERPADILARYGGEEFVCLLPETDNEGACNVAEKMRDNVSALMIPHEFSSASGVVTVSVGVATAYPTRTLPFELLLKTADDQLYEAKRAGRNRIQCTEVGLP